MGKLFNHKYIVYFLALAALAMTLFTVSLPIMQK
jgi:hypothetical protein